MKEGTVIGAVKAGEPCPAKTTAMGPPSASTLMQTLRKGPLKVAILGSGNWASAVAMLVCPNAKESYIFDSTVKMWVYDSPMSDGRMLTEWINSSKENIQYLPGFKLPDNLVAVPSIVETVKDADLLIFVLPHQFVVKACEQIKSQVKHTAQAISLVKGLHVLNEHPMLFSDVIRHTTGLECCALSGANVAKDVALQQFCETTVGYHDQSMGYVWQQLFDRPFFRVGLIPDVKGIQICGALKNLVALAAGFCDGLGLGTNAKSAIIRLGVEEIRLFAALFFDGCLEDTFFESAGFADVITTCFGGRNVLCAAEFIRRGGPEGKTSWEAIETELLNGMKMQGQLTCAEVHEVLDQQNLEEHFPLFTACWEVSYNGAPAETIYKVFMSADTRPIKLPEQCTGIVSPKSLSDVKKLLRQRLASEISRNSSFISEVKYA